MRNQLLKRIWGLAKQVGLEKEDVYTIVYREAGKEHMSDCTDKQLEQVLATIIAIKDINAWRPGMATKRQLWKMRELENALGWTSNPKRLQAFVSKYYRVQSIEWLGKEQAICCIDSLKNILKKEQAKTATEQEKRESHAD